MISANPDNSVLILGNAIDVIRLQKIRMSGIKKLLILFLKFQKIQSLFCPNPDIIIAVLK